MTEVSISSNTSLKSVIMDKTVLSRPRSRQLAIKVVYPHSYWFVIAVWALFAICAIATTIVAVTAYKTDTLSQKWMDASAEVPNSPTPDDYWESFGQVAAPFCHNPFGGRRDWLALIIQCAELSIIMLGLHCAEILVHLWRDEEIWRKASTIGADPDIGSFTAGLTCIPYGVLFVVKFLAPWMFGLGFDANCFLFATFLPIIVLTFLTFLLALFVEFIVRRQPRGTQPATYGHIRTLVSLVDEWQHTKIFWGDKGEISDHIRKAGSDGRRMADLRAENLYTGIRSKLK
jgi:hypothetical protein